ncbi:MAG: hypothetical protein ACI3XI_06240 [Eubacteriales bacterium]
MLDILQCINNFDVSVYILSESELQNTKYCYAVVIPTDKLASFHGANKSNAPKDTGVYIIDCDLNIFYNANKSTNFEGIAQIEKIIRDNFDICEDESVIAFARHMIESEKENKSQILYSTTLRNSVPTEKMCQKLLQNMLNATEFESFKDNIADIQKRYEEYVSRTRGTINEN